jgi:hypothetical protein
MMHQYRENLYARSSASNCTLKSRHELHLLENAPTLPENSFFLESSAPATPQLTMSGSSSFSVSTPPLTSSSSSPVTPVTEFPISVPDWPMPRVSEELTHLFIPHNRATPLVKSTFNLSMARNIVDENSSSSEYEFGANFMEEKDRPTSNPQSPHIQQKSGESATHTLSRFTSRLPSLSTKWRHRKNSSLSTGNSGDTAKTATSSRSSSVTSGFDRDVNSLNMPPLSRHNSSAIEPSPPASPYNSSIFSEYGEDPIDRVRLSSTPLLPPKMEASLKDGPISQSLLPSPLMVDESRTPSVFSFENSPSAPHARGLSTQPSIASFQRRSKKITNPSTEIPASLVLPAPDKWSDLLGHANFTIYPEPYLPIRFDRASCLKLASDWEAARTEFFKQQARTLEHYGPNSKTYKLTEDKWSEINGQWKLYIDQAITNAVAQGEDLNSLINLDINIFKRMPKFNPHIDGKFPSLGDQNIVGPMEIGQQMSKPSSPTHKQSSSKLFKLGSLFGKGSADEKLSS